MPRPKVNLAIRLSEHFMLEEFTHSATARRQGYPNIPLKCHITKLQHLAECVLEPVRQHFGQPVVVTSGYRCPRLNADVGGQPDSQHLRGEAADFCVQRTQLREVWEWMRQNVPYDQLILEHGRWIHVSLRLDMKKNRQQAFCL